MTQQEIASMLSMSQTGYSKYETGENDIPTTILRKLAIIHNTSVDYLLDLTDDNKPYSRSKCDKVLQANKHSKTDMSLRKKKDDESSKNELKNR